jgi:SAM-dependent methyltransferase
LLYLERNRLYRTLPHRRLILNIGAGSGSFVKNYPVRSCFIVNVDKGESVSGFPAFGLKHKGFDGLRQATKNDLRILNVKMDILDLWRFPDKVFDMVVCGQVFEHFGMRDLELVLAELDRVLVPGGLLQVDTVTPKLGESTHGHEMHFTVQSLDALLRRFLFRKQQLFTFAEGTALWALYERES